MITYRLNGYGFALKYVDDAPTGEWANVETNQQYLAWLAEGNEPETADPQE